MSLIDLGVNLRSGNCLYCVNGMAPAGIHPDLGPVMSLCPTKTWCDECGGLSLYPVEYETLDDRVNEMLDDGYSVIWCGACCGATAVIPVTNDGGIR